MQQLKGTLNVMSTTVLETDRIDHYRERCSAMFTDLQAQNRHML